MSNYIETKISNAVNEVFSCMHLEDIISEALNYFDYTDGAKKFIEYVEERILEENINYVHAGKDFLDEYDPHLEIAIDQLKELGYTELEHAQDYELMGVLVQQYLMREELYENSSEIVDIFDEFEGAMDMPFEDFALLSDEDKEQLIEDGYEVDDAVLDYLFDNVEGSTIDEIYNFILSPFYSDMEQVDEVVNNYCLFTAEKAEKEEDEDENV